MTSPPPVVSVAMITYNHEKYVAEAIRSVLDQTFSDLEVVIVDDGSTDRTSEVIRSIIDPRIVSIRQPNGGPGAALNRAIEACRGHYVAVLSGDDVSEPHRLQIQIEEYARRGPGILFSGCTFIDDDGRPITDGDFVQGVFDTSTASRAQILWRFFFQHNFICAVSAFAERRLFHDIGPFDPVLYQLQDFDMWLRFVKKYPLSIIPEPLVRYRIRAQGGNLSAPSSSARIRDSNERYLIMRRFFDDCPDELFREAFAAQLRRPDLVSPIASACEQAFLYLESPRPVLRYIGMERFQELFRDPGTTDVLTNDFRFPIVSFVSRLKEIDPFDRHQGVVSTAFVDTVAGFNPNELVTIGVAADPHFRISFDLTKFSSISAVRWDPVEGRFCRVALQRVAWRDREDRETVVDLASIHSNGHTIGLAAFEFETIDPMIFIPISGDIADLRLEGTWTIDRPDTTQSKIFDRIHHLAVERQRAEERIAELEREREALRQEREQVQQQIVSAAALIARTASRRFAGFFDKLRTVWRPLKSGGVFSS
jgi:glycosyltransferase involved in cell wall biosynthesis